MHDVSYGRKQDFSTDDSGAIITASWEQGSRFDS